MQYHAVLALDCAMIGLRPLHAFAIVAGDSLIKRK
jgi:hypothetical protein